MLWSKILFISSKDLPKDSTPGMQQLFTVHTERVIQNVSNNGQTPCNPLGEKERGGQNKVRKCTKM